MNSSRNPMEYSCVMTIIFSSGIIFWTQYKNREISAEWQLNNRDTRFHSNTEFKTFQ